MKTKITSVLLALCLLFGTLTLSSCSLFDGKDGIITNTELHDAIREQLDQRENLNLNVHYVTINSNSSSSLLSASRALLSTVSVYCTFTVRTLTGFGPYREWVETESKSAGAGVIYKMSDEDKAAGDAFVITNYHVVHNASASTENSISDKIELYLYGQEGSEAYAIPATFVGGSMIYDIAILRVRASDVLRRSNARPAILADSSELSVLETAIAIGNPEGDGISATVGHVNVDSEYVAMTAVDGVSKVEMRLIRTDAAVNSGNSGGGLFNDRGELIGIVNAKIASGDVDNIGYAIPSNVAKYVAENILYYCDGEDCENMYRCLLGVTVKSVGQGTVYDLETGKVHRTETVAVGSITKGSLADGVLLTDDVIHSIKIADKTYEVKRMYDVVDTMINARVGDVVTLNITRGGERKTLSITITESSLTLYK